MDFKYTVIDEVVILSEKIFKSDLTDSEKNYLIGKLNNFIEDVISLKKTNLCNLGVDNSNSPITKKLDPEERKLLVKKLKNDGMVQTDIASYLNISQKTVSNDLKDV